ncbi:tyrosine-type recombinase/integrase [Candidatus Nanohalovita haloferacivicina]|uniref:tyrosine-type recombinase/integrase n=1 Tax=Candidatus Nanohalovita haloferacivicina TaxID=2978046 RepID=UPI00325FA7E4
MRRPGSVTDVTMRKGVRKSVAQQPTDTHRETTTMTNYDSSDIHRRLETLKNKNCVSQRNAQLLDEFVEELQARDGTSDSRTVWYISKFSTILQQYLRKDRFEKDTRIDRTLEHDQLDELTKSDLLAVIGVMKKLPMNDLWTERAETKDGILTPLQAKERLSEEAFNSLEKIDSDSMKYKDYEPSEEIFNQLQDYSAAKVEDGDYKLTEFGENIKDVSEPEKYAEKTMNGFKTAFKMFLKLRHPLKMDRPRRVKRIIQSGILKGNTDADRKTELHLFSPEQIWKMVEAARNPRDALLPILCLDAGARNKEIRKVKLSDIEKQSETWIVEFIDSKNGKPPRDLPLTHCIEQLRAWLESHPRKDDPDAPLFVTLNDKGDGEKGSELKKENINKILKRLAKRADVVDNPETVKVYDFRHSSATFRGTEQDWGVSRMMYWYAWKKPDRAKTYCHEDNKRMTEAILKDKGIKTEDNSNNSMQMQECPRCEEKRPANAEYCPKCSLPLDSETAMRDADLKKAAKILVDMKLDEKIEDEELKGRLQRVREGI